MDPITWALIISAAASAVGAGAKYKSDKATAEGMVPDDWHDRLAELQDGGMGITPEQQASIQSAGAAMRGGALTDAQAMQRAVAAVQSTGGALSARDIHRQDVATQETQAKMLNEQDWHERQVAMKIEADNDALAMQLQQRIASQAAAEEAAKWNALGSFAAAGATTAGAWGAADQQAQANEMWLNEQAKNREMYWMVNAYGGQYPYDDIYNTGSSTEGLG